MSTLRKIASQVIELESGGPVSNDSGLSLLYVIELVRQVANALLPGKIYEKLNQDDKSPLQLMIATYTVTVQKDSDGNKYLTLPEFSYSLPFNKGVSIAPVDDPTNEFIPRNNPAVSRVLPCSKLDPDQYSYWQRGTTIFFDDDIEFNKVLVNLLVAAPNSLGPDDQLPLYPEMQADVIQKVREMLKTMPIQDKIQDNNPNKGVKTN